MTSTGLLILASGFLLMALATVPEVSRRMRGMFYGWFMTGVGALILALASTPLWHGLPVWSPVLRNNFGWTTVQLSWAFAVTRIEGGLLGPVEGFLIQKLGTRRVVFIGLSILGSGFVLFSQIRELWQLYAAFFIINMGSALSTWLPMMTLMNHWFIRRKARAMSLVLEGFALGGIAVPLLLAWAIGGTDPEISERYGWRNSALFIGILILVLAFPLSQLLRNRPEDLGLKPDGDSPIPPAVSSTEASVTPSETEEEGYTWQETIRTRNFWLISFGHAASAIVTVTIYVHLGLMLDDRGFSLQTISAVVAVNTAVNAIFILVGGYFGDRLPIRLMAFGFSILTSLSVVVLVLAHNTEILFLFAVLLGVATGGRSPVMTALRGHYFGRKAFAAISGISMVPMNICLFIAPLFAGFMRDATGTYDVSFLTIAAISLCGSFLFLLMGEPPGLSARTVSGSQAAD